MAEIKRIFMVDGKPFFPLGRHRIYMGGYSVRSESEIEENLKAAKLTHGNTVCMAIFWDQLEPEEGKFDFSSVDVVIKIARKYELKLIFLWFATWKNGVMDYAPEYMKANPQRYRRVVASNGKSIWVLSSHCKANLEADIRAFTALCKHLKAVDNKDHTVIGLQVENEPGILGSDRDYSPEAQAVFDSPVPAKLISAMKAAGRGEVYDIWQQSGGKKSGSWPELFGAEAGELMTAWSIATYINAVSKAGKAVYDIPMFINVWVSSINWWPVAGECYPSGCPVVKVLDIVKWFTPDVDIIAPDNPHENPRMHESLNDKYTRDDNQLLMVEAPGGVNMMRAISDNNAVGYFMHFDTNEDGAVIPGDVWNVELTRTVAAAIPLILKYQGTGKIHAVVQEEGMGFHGFIGTQMDFDGYLGLIEFREPIVHGAGLIFQVSKKEFYLTGINYRIMLRPKPPSVALLAGNDLSHPSFCNYVMRVDEGHFDKNGQFVSDCRRNGDSLRGGIWVRPSDGVVRVIMCD